MITNKTIENQIKKILESVTHKNILLEAYRMFDKYSPFIFHRVCIKRLGALIK
jgi:hypothetical protein